MMTTYTVLVQHYGDQQYFAGDKRVVDDELMAKRLIKMGLITEEKQPAKKAAPKPKNKMAQEPSNKAE